MTYMHLVVIACFIVAHNAAHAGLPTTAGLFTALALFALVAL